LDISIHKHKDTNFQASAIGRQHLLGQTDTPTVTHLEVVPLERVTLAVAAQNIVFLSLGGLFSPVLQSIDQVAL
jgi:hypothetical protein